MFNSNEVIELFYFKWQTKMPMVGGLPLNMNEI